MNDEFYTMDDLDFTDKIVLLRIDVNSPVENGVVQSNERVVEHAKTIRELSDKKAKVVVLAHQGRAGDPDFLPLEQHARILSKFVKRRVKYVDDLIGSSARKAVSKLGSGKIILLENTRFLAEETLEKTPLELSKTIFVKTLSSLAQIFVNDAFSVAHRAQASSVGFPQAIVSCAGRVMEREYRSISKLTSLADHPVVYLLGGAKPFDQLLLLKKNLENKAVDAVLTCGVLGELFLLASGKDVGPKKSWLEEKGFAKIIPELRQLLDRHGDKIETPIDFAFQENGERIEIPLDRLNQLKKVVYDIGSSTAEKYASILKSAKTVYVKGTCGLYEEPLFEKGTRLVFKSLEKTNAFTLIGGGHTISAIEKFHVNKKKISHISLAGGALMAMLQGKELPGVTALKENREKFSPTNLQ